MTDEQLRKGNELTELIKVTKVALNNLRALKPEGRKEQGFFDDKLYNLCICKHSDGSGIKGNLNRYFGNETLINVIIKELERQLEEFEKWYKEL